MEFWLLGFVPQLLLANIQRVDAELVTCSTTYHLENGYVGFSTNKTYVNGSTEKAFCEEGFKLSGDVYVTCLDDGNWTKNTSCLPITCSTDNSIQHGVILFSYNDIYAINDSVRINCSAGYNATDDGFITCLSDGNWSKTTCAPIDDEKIKDTETVNTELLKKLLVVGGVFLIAIGACIAVLLIFRQAREAVPASLQLGQFLQPPAHKVRQNRQDDIEKADLTTFDMEIKVWGKFRSEAVPVSEYPAYVDELHKKNNIKFADAFRLLTEQSPFHSTSAAETPACRSKTRFSNILPFDHSRVALTPREGVDGSDFINANYIPGYNSPTEFIATQGPVSETKNDFWRMVWEQDVQIIVMLTERIEKGKGSLPRNCSLDRHWLAQTFEPYWPDMVEGLVLYGDLVIKTDSETIMSDHIFRKISIQKDEKTREIKHLQFVGWPDRRKLKKTWPFLTFVTTVRHLQTYSTGKHTVVHCSNGVGRTGIFIAVDTLIQQAREEKSVDVISTILNMRNNRCNMVKTEEHLVYIFECLRHYITMESDEEDAEEYDDSQYVSIEEGHTTFDNVAFFKEDGEGESKLQLQI